MTKEELEKEAMDYANKWLKEVKDLELYHNKTDPKPKYIRIKEAYLAGVEPREKQIQIDTEQIRALQKQNGELNDKCRMLEDIVKEYIRIESAIFDNEDDVFVAKRDLLEKASFALNKEIKENG